MKTLQTSLALLLSAASFTQAQPQIVSQDYNRYYEWFHQRSQTQQLYADDAQLYAFLEGAPVRNQPHREAERVATLSLGQPIRNIAYADYQVPQDKVNGYYDFWHKVRYRDARSGAMRKGYVWGAHIAKAWVEEDLTNDGHPELLMMGISSRPRAKGEDFMGEIRIVQSGSLLARKEIPRLCVFEACDVSTLLRVIRNERLMGIPVVEISTMAIGCVIGIDKVYYTWDGSHFQPVHYAEYTQGHVYGHQIFNITLAHNKNGRPISILQCEYSHENKQFDPVWKCEVIDLEPAQEAGPIPLADR